MNRILALNSLIYEKSTCRQNLHVICACGFYTSISCATTKRSGCLSKARIDRTYATYSGIRKARKNDAYAIDIAVYKGDGGGKATLQNTRDNAISNVDFDIRIGCFAQIIWITVALQQSVEFQQRR